MSFVLEKKFVDARTGVLRTLHGDVSTPFFMPIATKGAVKTLGAQDLKSLGANILLSNTYHLYLRPGMKVIEASGGLHPFMRWDGPILTDSGGYQVFSLAKTRTLSDAGAVFQSHWDGSSHLLTPEDSIRIQRTLASDVVMVLDECSPYLASHAQAAAAVDRTTLWAQRCKSEFVSYPQPQKQNSRSLLFGIVQGALYEDLRLQSAQQLLNIGFDGYAIGGLSVGEPAEDMYRILDAVCPSLPEDAPRYLMGVGKPENILEAVKRGVDMFDCVLPTRNARHALLYVWKSRDITPWIMGERDDLFYNTVHITNAQYQTDTDPLDPLCRCRACKDHYSKAYLRHLFRVEEPLALRLATSHNLVFYFELLTALRTFLRENGKNVV